MPNLYKCAFTNCEIFSDAFPTEEVYGGYIFAVQSEMVTKEAMKFEMGDCDDIEDANTRVNNIVDACQLGEANFDKKSFLSWMKPYIAKVTDRVKEKHAGNEEYLAGFKTQATEWAKMVIANFDKFEGYVNEENDYDGTCAIGVWKDKEAKGPVFYFFKDALIREKI